ncbi:MAG: leucine-rich repeat domain-containing protein [Prevotella sp.]|nr:leucine-rich repeat domain-containing protein [Prevotella sp.]
MRKTYTLIVMLAMMFVGVNNASAQTSYTDEQGVTYSIGDTYATVTGYTGSATDVVIPATIGEGEVPVTHVGASAFANKTALTTVRMEAAGEINFADNAFNGCSALTAVNLTAGQTKTVGASAFRGCTVLKTIGATTDVISLPLVENLSDYAFYGALALTTVELPVATRIGDNAFRNTTNNPNGITTITGGEKLTYVGNYAFYGCNNLKTIGNTTGLVYLPKVCNVGYYTFLNCRSIEAVKVNESGANSYTSFYDYAFYGCTNLTKVKARNPYLVNQCAFYGCSKLLGIDNNDNPTRVYLCYTQNVGANAFRNCSSITTVYTTTSLTSIAANAFNGCSNLASITLNTENPPTLGADAFTGIKSGATFVLNPTNSYKFAKNYANSESWKVLFDATNNYKYYLHAYVNKSKQYGTVSCDLPLYFLFFSTVEALYKVIAADDAYSYLKAVSSRKLPANTGAVIEKKSTYTATGMQVRVLFDGTENTADWSDNQLVANVTENTNFVGNEGNTWNLILNDGTFVKAKDGPLAAGLAYLPVTFEGGEAKELSLTTDEPTGIKTIDNGEPTVDNGAWYTIDGTRLQGEPTMKGIYVRGGKKVVVK